MKSYLVLLALFASYITVKCTEWDNVRVTWGLNPFDPQYFNPLPLTETEAIAKGWTRDKDCSQINGIRYVLNNDRAIMVVYGTNGQIVGVSSAIPKNLPFNFPSNENQAYLNDENEYYTINAYFVDPTTVCSSKH